MSGVEKYVTQQIVYTGAAVGGTHSISAGGVTYVSTVSGTPTAASTTQNTLQNVLGLNHGGSSFPGGSGGAGGAGGAVQIVKSTPQAPKYVISTNQGFVQTQGGAGRQAAVFITPASIRSVPTTQRFVITQPAPSVATGGLEQVQTPTIINTSPPSYSVVENVVEPKPSIVVSPVSGTQKAPEEGMVMTIAEALNSPNSPPDNAYQDYGESSPMKRGGGGRGRGRGSGVVGRKKKDANAPQPALSAYKFFFKEISVTVKKENPSVKFGDLSRIVSSMWESLSDDEKAKYREESEYDKRRFEEELSTYNNSCHADDSLSATEDSSSTENNPDESPIATSASSTSSTTLFESSSNTPSVLPKTDNSSFVSPEDMTDNLCINKGCTNMAVRNSEWEDEYCSNECVVLHCSNVFTDWVSMNLTEQEAAS